MDSDDIDCESEHILCCDNCGMPARVELNEYNANRIYCGCRDNEVRYIQPSRHLEALEAAETRFREVYVHIPICRCVDSLIRRQANWRNSMVEARAAYIRAWDEYTAAHTVPDWPPPPSDDSNNELSACPHPNISSTSGLPSSSSSSIDVSTLYTPGYHPSLDRPMRRQYKGDEIRKLWCE